MDYRDKIKEAINRNRDNILEFLKKLVDCNSYSYNKEGIDNVGRLIQQEMPPCFASEMIRHDTYGDNYIYRNAKSAKGLPILLAGHMDTLCPEDENFNTMETCGDKLTGPGVNDMKSGDTVLIWSLKILEELGLLKDIPITCIFNSDEEIGSLFSKDIFLNMKGKAKMAFIFECGGPEGTVVTTRKSYGRYRLDIKGKANHFGNLHERKISAVEELAHKIIQFEALNTDDGSVAANAGKVAGGLAPNAVAEHAWMDFEARHWSMDQEYKTREKIKEIMTTPTVSGCQLSLETILESPPMEPSEMSMEMFDLIVTTGDELGQKISEEKRGGRSDGNWLASVGIPTIDGLGPLGDCDFTPDEYIVKDTLFQRIELVTNLLMKAYKKWY